MRKTVVREGETTMDVALRLHLPLCMLLRANRVFSGAWLLPGREIDVPTGDFCRKSDFPCPARMACVPAAERRLYLARIGETREEIACACRIPVRMVARNTRALCVPTVPEGWKIHTVKPGESVISPYVRSVNGLFGPIFPGTQMLMPREE